MASVRQSPCCGSCSHVVLHEAVFPSYMQRAFCSQSAFVSYFSVHFFSHLPLIKSHREFWFQSPWGRVSQRFVHSFFAASQ